MTIEEIRSSGLLESYILGVLSGAELAEVEQHLNEFPELKTDIQQIERAFRAYAEIHGIPPRPELKAEIIKSVTGKTYTPNTKPAGMGFGPFFLPALLLMVLLGIAWFWGNRQSNKHVELSEEFAIYQQECDSIALRNEALQDIITNISSAGNRTLQLVPTGNYASTNLILHVNEEDGTNYLQAISLPTISADQAFQLWSLKDGTAPIPLTVFEARENEIFEVDFEAGTGVYAITIEQVGGALTPDLERLIGTIRV